MSAMAPGCEVEEWVACDGGANVQRTDIAIKSTSLENIDDPLWNEGFKGAPEARIQQTVEGAQIRWEMDGQYPF